MNVHVLGQSPSCTIKEVQRRNDLTGLGFSDARPYVDFLEQCCRFTNTFLHTEPHRDITDVTTFGDATYDFIVCSEVLEHINRPVETAIRNLFSLLRPGGVLILSVPMVDGETSEHFPSVRALQVHADPEEGWRVEGETDSGRFESRDVVFHGGPGATLEMRLWGRKSMARLLEAAGFVEIEERRVMLPERGLLWNGPDEQVTEGGLVRGLDSGIWAARRPAER